MFVFAHQEHPVSQIPNVTIVPPPVPLQPPPVLPAVPSVVEPLPVAPPSPAFVGPAPPVVGNPPTSPDHWPTSFLPKRYDFGTAEQGKPLHAWLPIVNKRNVSVEITNVRVSCGCLSARVTEKIIEADRGATLQLVLDTRRFNGPKTMTVFVEVTAAGERHEYSIVITATSARPEDMAKAYPEPSQFNGGTMQQANRDLTTLMFYANTGHRESAAFYRDLIERNYPDSLYSRKAAQLLQEMKPPIPSRIGATYVGEIIIVGNKYLPDVVIRRGLGYFPGQPRAATRCASITDTLISPTWESMSTLPKRN